MLLRPSGASLKRVFFFCVTLIAPLLVTLLAIETGLRFMNFRSPVIHAEMFSPNAGDPLLPYALRAGYRGTFGGGAVQIFGAPRWRRPHLISVDAMEAGHP